MDKETEKMLEILHKNHLKEREQLHKKGHKAQNIVLIVVGIILIGLCFWLFSFLNKDFVEDCTSAGYEENYCLYQISH